jgi:hypothetical protein
MSANSPSNAGATVARPAGTLWRLACVAVCSLAAVVGLTACGSSGSPGGASASATQDAFKFSKCMREQGIANFPDPQSGANGQVRLQFNTKVRLNPRTLQAAQRACRRYSPIDRIKLTPAQKVEREEAVRKFAKCMREHGVNLPTPSSSDGGFRIQLGRPGAAGGGGPNPDSPAFQSAQKACQGLLPKRPGGGPGGPQTTRSGAAGAGAGFSLSAGG